MVSVRTSWEGGRPVAQNAVVVVLLNMKISTACLGIVTSKKCVSDILENAAKKKYHNMRIWGCGRATIGRLFL